MGFEFWRDTAYFGAPVKEPVNWISNSSIVGSHDRPIVERYSPGFTGQYAVRINAPKGRLDSIFTSSVGLGKTATNGNGRGLPCRLRPAGISGRYIFRKGLSMDEAYIGMGLRQAWNSGMAPGEDIVGSTTGPSLTESSTFTNFYRTIEYGDTSLIPDTANISLFVMSHDTSASPGGYLIVDDLFFEGRPLAISGNFPKPDLICHYVPSRKSLWIHTVKTQYAWLSDVLNKPVSAKKILEPEKENWIEMDALPSGFYFLRTSYGLCSRITVF